MQSAQGGQGKPLPEFLGLSGEWVVEDQVFLHYPDPNEAKAGTAPRFTRRASRHDGRPCIGFDVSQLAGAFGLTVDGVLAANRDYSLICRGRTKSTPRHGGRTAITYAFRIGSKDAYLTVESNDDEGTA